MNKSIRITAIIILILLLILVRAFESALFYDPFILFFENEFLITAFPKFDFYGLFSSLFFRFSINSILSLGILHLLFSNKNQLVFAIKFYIIAGILLSIVYYFQIESEFSNGYLIPFYIRRLLIHPIFLLLLVAAFFYQKKI